MRVAPAIVFGEGAVVFGADALRMITAPWRDEPSFSSAAESSRSIRGATGFSGVLGSVGFG
jgi:hypothetical protein